MKIPKNFAHHIMIIYECSSTLQKNIEDYEHTIHNDKELKSKFYNIDFVYMRSIILNLHILKGSVDRLEKFAPLVIKQKISELCEEHVEIFAKIKNNRHKLIAHFDISQKDSYVNLLFSAQETEKRIEDYQQSLKLRNKPENEKLIEALRSQQSTSKEYERFSPSDFYEELKEFKSIITKVVDIADEFAMYVYKKS